MNHSRFVPLAIGLVSALAASLCSAQLIVNPAVRAVAGHVEAGGILSMAEVDYELGGRGDGTIERTVFGTYGAYGMCSCFDVYGVLGFIIESEPDGWHDSGTGFILSGGSRATILDMDPFYLMAYGELRYIDEDYGENESVDMDGYVIETLFGATANYYLMDNLGAYAVLEAVPFSDGEVEASGRGISLDDDIEREDPFTVRFGANYHVDLWTFRAELALLSEQAVTVGAGLSF